MWLVIFLKSKINLETKNVIIIITGSMSEFNTSLDQ